MENIKLSGKNAFDIFLDIITQSDVLFLKNNIYNTGDYYYFFTSEKINNIQEIIDKLERKKSLKLAYYTLSKLKNLRLSYYFAIKGYTLYYGFHNENSKYVYKCGKFKVYTSDLKRYARRKSMKTIRDVLKNANIKKIKDLHKVKKEFSSLFEGIGSDIKILDKERIKNTYPIEIIRKEDRDEIKLRIFLTKWAMDFNWFNKYHYYIHLTENNIHFYIKYKNL